MEERTRVRDVFISRVGTDKDIALEIAAIVREAGYTTLLQDEDFGHESFMALMEQGSESARVIALLSQAYQRSEYTRKEYNTALAADPLNIKERLIVLRIEDCAPSGNLRDLIYIDVVPILQMKDAKARAELLRGVVRVAIGAETRKAEIDLAKIYRQVPQILHAEVQAVAGFAGREAELEALDKALWAKGGTAALTNSGSAAVSGLGGVGKSVLAKEYAWRSRERYRGVWWVRAEKRETMLDDLIELGARFITGLPEVGDREQAARATLDFLSSTRFDKPWLILYDNVERPADIEKLTPRSGAHVVITTRWSDWYGLAEALPVDVFSPEVAIDYLLARARESAVKPAETREAAARLSQDLGYLPLALAIARSQAWGMNWSFDQYRDHLAEMLNRAPTGPVDYPRSVFATFTLALEKAISTAPEAETLLGIAAYLAPDRIPFDIIKVSTFPGVLVALAGGALDVMSEIERGEAVAALSEGSLITLETLDDNSKGFSVHRLLQSVMRERLGETGEAFAALATRLVVDAYPRGDRSPDDVRFWPACRRLEGHASAVLTVAPDVGAAARYTSQLLNQYAAHLRGRAEFALAEPLMRRALAINEKSYGPDHPTVSTSLNNLAQLLQATNRLAEAEPLFRRALAISEKSYEPDHPTVAVRLNNLGEFLRATNRLAEAEPLFRRALAIAETNYGPDHPEVAPPLNNLAGLLRANNRLAEAEPMYRRSLAIVETSYGPDHPQVAIRLHNLAQLLQASNRLAEAEPLMRRALPIVETSYGLDHPDVATNLHNLAQLLEASNRLAEAEPLFRRALAIDEKIFGPDHQKVAIRLCRLARLLEASNRLAEAEPLYRRALAIDEKSYRTDANCKYSDAK
jgi:tetratricopeptide (TPR) repeat protein